MGAYTQERGIFLKMNSYEKNLHDNVASLLTKAYGRVATIEKAVKGFQSTGIFPFDKNIFPDEDFALPNENASIPGNVTPPQEIHRPSTSSFQQQPPDLHHKRRTLNDSTDSDESVALAEISDDLLQ
jgi:hypothetical protein